MVESILFFHHSTPVPVNPGATFVADIANRAKTFHWQPDTVGPSIALTTTRNNVTIPDPMTHSPEAELMPIAP